MRYLLTLLTLCLPLFCFASTADDAQIPDTLTLGEHTLTLNGAGIRSKYFMDVYVAGLYLPAPNQNATEIIQADEPQTMRLVITSSHITKARLLDSIEEGVEKSAGADYPRFKPHLKELEAALNFEVQQGDQYDFSWIPGSGTHVYRNGEALQVLPTLAFKQVLFGIWLGEDPVQRSLKQALLLQ